jgi:hypothetical protein
MSFSGMDSLALVLFLFYYFHIIMLFAPSMRELLALAQAITRDGPGFLSARTRLIFWQTDNQACTWFIQHGSRNPTIQQVIFAIKC